MNPRKMFVGGKTWDVLVYEEHRIGTMTKIDSSMGEAWIVVTSRTELNPVGLEATLYYTTEDGAIEWLLFQWLNDKYGVNGKSNYRVKMA